MKLHCSVPYESLRYVIEYLRRYDRLPSDEAPHEFWKHWNVIDTAIAATRRLGTVTVEEITPETEARVQEKFNRAAAEHTCTGDPCTCTNGIGCINVPYDEW
jgi:hypothetical protein